MYIIFYFRAVKSREKVCVKIFISSDIRDVKRIYQEIESAVVLKSEPNIVFCFEVVISVSKHS